jgi:hypothetical protein
MMDKYVIRYQWNKYSQAMQYYAYKVVEQEEYTAAAPTLEEVKKKIDAIVETEIKNRAAEGIVETLYVARPEVPNPLEYKTLE